MKKNNQKGFAFLELILVIVVLGLLIFAGLKVYGSHKNSIANQTAASTTTTASKVSGTATPVPAVTDKSDLDKAQSALNTADTSSNTSAESQMAAQDSDF